jgi:hypothetical protein
MVYVAIAAFPNSLEKYFFYPTTYSPSWAWVPPTVSRYFINSLARGGGCPSWCLFIFLEAGVIGGILYGVNCEGTERTHNQIRDMRKVRSRAKLPKIKKFALEAGGDLFRSQVRGERPGSVPMLKLNRDRGPIFTYCDLIQVVPFGRPYIEKNTF